MSAAVRRVSAAIRRSITGALQAVRGFGSRNAYEIAAATLSVVGVALLQSPLGALLRVPLSIIRTERDHRAAARDRVDQEALERGALSFVAGAARTIMLETPMWQDIDTLLAWRETHQDEQRFSSELPTWSVNDIVARGREPLGPDRPPWHLIADALRSNAGQLSGAVGAYSGSLPRDAQLALAKVLEVAERAAVEAEGCASAREWLRNMRDAVPDQRERATDRFEQCREAFYGALQWLVGRVEALEQLATSAPEEP